MAMRMTLLVDQLGHLPIPVAGRDNTMIDSLTRTMRYRRLSKGRAAEEPDQECPEGPERSGQPRSHSSSAGMRQIMLCLASGFSRLSMTCPIRACYDHIITYELLLGLAQWSRSVLEQNTGSFFL